MDQIWALGRTRREPSRPGPFPFAFPVGRGPVTAPSEFERALGALYGLAIGDAMRVRPVGIGWPVNDFDGLLPAVVDGRGVTHSTALALGGASGGAAAVSAGVGGANHDDAIDAGLSAARLDRNLGSWVAGAD